MRLEIHASSKTITRAVAHRMQRNRWSGIPPGPPIVYFRSYRAVSVLTCRSAGCLCQLTGLLTTRRRSANAVGTRFRKWDGAPHHILGEVGGHFPERALAKTEPANVEFHGRSFRDENSRPEDYDVNGLTDAQRWGGYTRNSLRTA